MSCRASWLRRFFPSANSPRRAGRFCGRFRPRLEHLEERCVPTIYSVNSLLDVTTRRLTLAMCTGKWPASLEAAEDLAEIESTKVGSRCRTPLPRAAAPSISPSSTPARTARIECRLAKLIVLLPLIRVADYVVRFLNLFELAFRRLVP